MATQLKTSYVHKGPLICNTATGMVTLGGVDIPLFPRTMAILVLLVCNDFVEMATLMALVKSRESLRVHMSTIRAYMPNGVTIENDEAKGYRLVVEG